MFIDIMMNRTPQPSQMAIVVKGATCSLGEAVVDRLLSWDIDVIAAEPGHAERNSTMLQYSPATLSSEGDGFSISFDGQEADIVIGRDLIIHDLLPTRADKWLAPEISMWLNGGEGSSPSRHWLSVMDAAEAICHILRAERRLDAIHMCGRREWLSTDSRAEFDMLVERTDQGVSGEFTAKTLFGHSIAGMEARPISDEVAQRPDLNPLHDILVELNGDGWRPLVPFRTALMTLIAGLKQ